LFDVAKVGIFILSAKEKQIKTLLFYIISQLKQNNTYL